MGELIREHPWEETDVGPVDKWPPSLLNTVSIMLSSRYLPHPLSLSLSVFLSLLLSVLTFIHHDTRTMHYNALQRTHDSRNARTHAQRTHARTHNARATHDTCMTHARHTHDTRMTHARHTHDALYTHPFFSCYSFLFRFPMILFWGKKLEVIYNDYYIPVSFT